MTCYGFRGCRESGRGYSGKKDYNVAVTSCGVASSSLPGGPSLSHPTGTMSTSIARAQAPSEALAEPLITPSTTSNYGSYL